VCGHKSCEDTPGGCDLDTYCGEGGEDVCHGLEGQ
jgi:hypothetical protein